VWILATFSTVNAFYTMTRSRKYRLFEVSVEQQPDTPSARRVRVQSDPVSSSPLRFMSDLISPETAESRAHPDKERDVWELSVWDPLPVCLRIFCLFSPGHVLVYILFLPLLPLDPRPSITVFNVLVLQAIISGQLMFLQSRFSQQVKDTAIINKEVFHEYDTKFVQPRLHPVVRDVGTQFDQGDAETEFVGTGTPTTLIKRSFQTHPNPNYVKHVDPDGNGSGQSSIMSSGQSNVMSPRLFTPAPAVRQSNAYMQHFPGSRSRQSLPGDSTPALSRNTSTSISTSTGSGHNFGGNLGVYTHHNSPLKKATSMDDMNEKGAFSPRNGREMAAIEQRDVAERMVRARRGSPLKEENRRSTMGGGFGITSNPFAKGARRDISQFERYPSIR
jgi:hypothetical protein